MRREFTDAGPRSGAAVFTLDGSPKLWVVAVGGLVLFLVAALIKAFVAAYPPRIAPAGSLLVYPTFELTVARLVPWVAWVPLAIVVWRIVPAIDGRARGTATALLIHAVCSAIVAGVHILLTVGANVLILEPEPSLALFVVRLYGLFTILFDWEVLTYWAIVAAAYAYLFAIRSRERELQAAELRAQLNAERLQSLLLQLNPHFLFNVLNAVTGLIYNDQREKAVATVSRLAELLRVTLHQEVPQQIPLRDEIELLRKYLAIEAVRFGDRITASIDVPRDLQAAMVPALLLQPLVENAIRHGVGRVPGPGEVRVSASRIHESIVLSVWNSGEGLARDGDRKGRRNGVGISNTRERLTRLYGASARLDLSNGSFGGSLVTVSFPFHDQRQPSREARTP